MTMRALLGDWAAGEPRSGAAAACRRCHDLGNRWKHIMKEHMREHVNIWKHGEGSSGCISPYPCLRDNQTLQISIVNCQGVETKHLFETASSSSRAGEPTGAMPEAN